MAKKQKQHRKDVQKSKLKGYTEEISKMRSDIKAFIYNFQSDVDKKKEAYQSYAQKFWKKPKKLI